MKYFRQIRFINNTTSCNIDNPRIINVARGGIINESDLAKVLHEGNIGGAALDVFENEHIESTNPLLSAPNLILTPHLGGSTKEAKASFCFLC